MLGRRGSVMPLIPVSSLGVKNVIKCFSKCLFDITGGRHQRNLREFSVAGFIFTSLRRAVAPIGVCLPNTQTTLRATRVGNGRIPAPVLTMRERVYFPHSNNTWTSTLQKYKIRRVARKALGPSKLATHCNNHGLRGSASPVLTATGFVNGRWQFSTPHRINTPW